MNQMVKMRGDIAISLIISILIGLVFETITIKSIEATNKPQQYISAEIKDGSIGAQAEDDTPRLTSIEEIKNHNGVFTIETRDSWYNRLQYTDFYYIDLISGETIIAKIQRDSIQSFQDRNTVYHVLPIGKVVNENIPMDILELASEYHQPTDNTFYLDMAGTHEGGYLYSPRDAKAWGENIFVISTFIIFLIVRYSTVKIGLFPPIIPRKKHFK